MGKIAGLLVALLIGCTSTASAQSSYPARPVRIVIGFGPGGLADITMRLLGQKLTELTGQQVTIENRPGAGGVVAAGAVTSAAPDGYTLFVLSSGIAISKSLLKSMPFDPVADFAPISTVAYFDLLILTRAQSSLRTMDDVLAAARANPGKFNIGTINPGSTQNLTAELLKSATGVNMTIVPHRSTPEVLTALLRDDVQIMVESYAALKAQIDDGQVRPLAASGDARSPMLPKVATLRESGIAAEVVGWNALVAPAQTPKDVVALINRHINTIVAMPDFRQRLLDLGTEARASTAEELGARLSADIGKWAAVVKQAGLEPR
ncbi:MAG TPA: tripartite tricarboxylate transporter substrate-binding protein [Xanthobacteraceae bacterium]|nr:tripartite tricarboxylate transporter substrate-binding protein [Xanthobacteraceae bacterium]